MEGILFGIIAVLFLWAGILSARLCCYRRQMSHMLRELAMVEQEDTNYLLTSAVEIGKTGEVITAMNRILEKNRRFQERIIRENTGYRESITGISHDIRTPLTSAKGYLQMLRGGCGGNAADGMADIQNACQSALTEEKRLAYTEIVERRLDDLAGLLDQLFLYARIEAGEMELTLEEVNAGNLFTEVISLFYEDFVRKGCEPQILTEPEPCYIRADRQAFSRIIENLIKNALVHGTGAFSLSLCRCPGSAGEQALIRVANATESIEAGDIHRIFDRFFTGDTSRSRRTTGLGLAIVKELTQLMGGEVEAGLEGGIFFVEVRFPLSTKAERR